MSKRVQIDGSQLSLIDVERVANGADCVLTADARARVRASRQVVERAIKSGRQVYGVNTGFGHLSHVGIEKGDLAALQQNLVRSHCTGVGAPLSERIVRAILVMRANCLARGHSGLRVETLQRLVDFLRHRIHPVVPEQGSVGASGDLAPLAHIALTLIGEGEVFLDGKRMPTERALRRVGMKPLTLHPKEGLALINGTQVMLAIGILALLQARRLATLADAIGAMSLEALLGSHRPFEKRLHDARPQPGQRQSAANMRRLLKKSALRRSHVDCGKVQDCYSLRCMPQVHGAVRDALDYIEPILAIEVNSSTDNPMVFVDRDEMISAGNFHGQPISLALDHLGTSVCTLGTISERRIERLLNPALSDMPAFLARDPGLDSGFMMAHVTAAALVSENKILAHPASVDTIPTSAGKEDHVSMGAHAARKAASIVDHVTTVLAIEWQCAAQALELRRPVLGGIGVESARRCLRRIGVAPLDGDRVLSGDIERARKALLDGTLIDRLDKDVGRLV